MGKFFFIFSLLFCFFGVPSVWPDEISLALRLISPYVSITKDGKYKGLEYEIIVAALAESGHTVKTNTYPLARVINMAKNGEVQAAAPVTIAHYTGRYLSSNYITYDNVAISLDVANLDIKSIADLRGLGIVAFQKAPRALGVLFQAIIRDNQNYHEVANQTMQVRMLFADRVEVAIGDSRIFANLMQNPETNIDTHISVREHRIFPPTEYFVAFLEEQHRNDFDIGLAKIKENGLYEDILAKYSAYIEEK